MSAEKGRFYINCPYQEKEEAKALGAKWDAIAKKWYYTHSKDKHKFIKWINIASTDDEEKNNSFKVYKIFKECYKCKKNTSVYTYIKYDDGTEEDVAFPWDKKRLLKSQNIVAHMCDSSIEYYGLKVIGDDEKYDKTMMKRYPNKIKIEYSKVLKRYYPMNLCDFCGAKQGWNYIYRQVNIMIMNMEKIQIDE
ncbi:MAG: hypothetical protein IJC02_13355 [Lachnospiraceae bacterium]|nr:hypothetical protein [Lachnospiraceae bacterium]